jgi:quercetin dioxygenase-like cupin family protein
VSLDGSLAIELRGGIMRTLMALAVVFIYNLGVNGATPLILEKNEGEARWWRPVPGDPGTSRFVLKVDPVNGGSDHLVVGTEDFAPGDSIGTHRHPSADELIIINSGAARVHLGDTERAVHAGAVVFIPMNTWIALHFTGRDTTNLTFVFSSPGFERFMRAESVREGEKNVPLTRAQSDSIDKRFAHHVVYR